MDETITRMRGGEVHYTTGIMVTTFTMKREIPDLATACRRVMDELVMAMRYYPPELTYQRERIREVLDDAHAALATPPPPPR